MLVTFFQDVANGFKNLLSGDFKFTLDNTDALIDGFIEKTKNNAIDMATGWLQADNAIVSSLGNVNGGMGDLANQASTLSDSLDENSKAAESAGKEYDKLSDKLKDIKKDMEEVKKEYKDSKKELITKYKEELKSQEPVLSADIAGILYDKEQELSELKQDVMTEESETRKQELDTQIAAIESFLNQHQNDYQLYADELKKIREFEALDEIQQLKSKFQEQQAETKAQHEQELKELKKNYEEKKDALKEHLKEIKKEIKEFLSSKEGKFISGGSSDSIDYSERPKGTSKKEWEKIVKGKAVGGQVVSNQSYLVGERGPEMFVPHQSGTIIPTEKTSGGATFNFNNTPPGVQIGINNIIQYFEYIYKFIERN
jgi:chromosome segregation ATPase